MCNLYKKVKKNGLEQVVNSIHAQRVTCERHINSQQDWIVLPKKYDYGGFSGSNLNRPKIKELFIDIKAGRIDCVVVYKFDRLTRED